MSLKGVKKAFARTPHQLMGKKMEAYDDDSMKTWEHDLITSRAGLLYIQTETSKYHHRFKELLKKELEITDLMRDQMYGDTEPDEIDPSTDIKHFQELLGKLSQNIDYKFDLIESNIGFRCKEVSVYLDSLLKMLKKRNHKKMDVEIYSANVQKYVTRQRAFSEKDMANMKKEQASFELAKRIFYEIDEKIKIIIPESLDLLSEFLSKLVLTFQISIKDIYSTISRTLAKFARNQGMLTTKNDDIIKEWQLDFAAPEFKLESLTLIEKYRDTPKPQSPIAKSTQFFAQGGNKIRKEVTSLGGHALDSTTLIWRKTIHPRTTSINLKTLKLENPVRPESTAGVFSTAIDPLWRESSPSSSTPPTLISTPIVPDSPGFSSSPWLKPLSLKKQTDAPDDTSTVVEDSPETKALETPELNSIKEKPDLHINTSLEVPPIPVVDKEDHSLNDVTVAETEAVTESDTIEPADGTSTEAYTTTKKRSVHESIELVAAEIRGIRSTYNKHMVSDYCPVEVDFNSKFIKDFLGDEQFRFQVSANSSISAQLLKLHLDI